MFKKLGIVASYTINNHDSRNLKKYRIWFQNGILKGIKIYCGYEYYYPNDERYQPIYDLCTEYDIPIMIHTGDTYSKKGKVKYSHPLNIDDIAVDNPDLNIVICHAGNPWILDCQEVVYKNKNVYADISGLVVGNFNSFTQKYYKIRIKEMLGYVGNPHRLLFGSDWPISNVNSYLNFVSNLNLDDETREDLMLKNAQNIFHI
jgi:predicted TIM-barrel fold metal-dependent hydrolase